VLVGNHALDLGHIGLVKHHVGIELPFALGSFGSQDVALERVSALDLARTCLLEALGRSAMSFRLRHSVFLLQHNAKRPPVTLLLGSGSVCNMEARLSRVGANRRAQIP